MRKQARSMIKLRNQIMLKDVCFNRYNAIKHSFPLTLNILDHIVSHGYKIRTILN